jgi:HK97 family phage prohead protease
MALEQKDFSFQIKAISEDGVFSGYGSVFGLKDSWDDIVQKGAFAVTLAKWEAEKRLPAMLWQHRQAEPVGIYTLMREDDVGLYVEGKLALKTTRGAEAYELMKMGAVGGLSIGYVSRDDSYDRVTGVRTLKQVDLYEVSVVTFPACDAARVTGVKSRSAAAETAAVKSLINILRSA